MLPRKPPSARTLARLMSSPPDRLSPADAMLVTVVDQAFPMLAAARDLVDRCHSMLRSKSSTGLDPWLSDPVSSLLGAFASGIAADRQAV
jgi:hypothetical protein